MNETLIVISFDQFKDHGCPGVDCQSQHNRCVMIFVPGIPWIKRGNAQAGINCRGCGTGFNVPITTQEELETLSDLTTPESHHDGLRPGYPASREDHHL